MGPIDYIILGVIALVVGGAALYIYRAKKSGQKCIGCPHSKTCSGNCGCGSESRDKSKDKDK